MAILPVPAMTDIPTFPGLEQRATGLYNSMAFDFATHMADDFNTEFLAVANNVKNNAEEALANAVLAQTSGDLVLLAQAAANFKGNYSSLAGALNMPASVAYGNDFWALNTNTANVVSDVPGVSAKWTRLRTGPGGALETSTAGSVTLTTASARVQAITTTAADQTVTLPNATLIATGGEVFMIENSGSFQFVVRDNSAGYLVALDPGQSAMFYLANNSSAAGNWLACMSEGSLAHTIYQGTGVNLNAAASNGVSVTALSPTLAIVVFRVSANAWAYAMTISGSTFTIGTPFNLGLTYSFDSPMVVAMSATTAIVTHASGSGTNFILAQHLTVSGTTINAGTQLAVNAVNAFTPVLASLSATQAVLIYTITSSNNLVARTLNVSGTTLTAGAEATVRATTAGGGQDVTTLSSTQALVVTGGSTGGTIANTLNVSGTTVTVGTALTVSAENTGLGVVGLSATQAMVYHLGYLAESISTRILTVAGTDVTAGTVTSQHNYNVTSNPSNRPGLAKLSANRVMAVQISPGVGGPTTRSGRVQMLGVSDGETIQGKVAALKSSYGDTVSLAPLTATKAIAAYTQASGYVQVRVLEIGT